MRCSKEMSIHIMTLYVTLFAISFLMFVFTMYFMFVSINYSYALCFCTCAIITSATNVFVYSPLVKQAEQYIY